MSGANNISYLFLLNMPICAFMANAYQVNQLNKGKFKKETYETMKSVGKMQFGIGVATYMLCQRPMHNLGGLISGVAFGTMIIYGGFSQLAVVYKDQRVYRPKKQLEEACKAIKVPTPTELESNTQLAKSRMPRHLEGVPKEQQPLIKGQYWQAMIGDADTARPRDLIGLNSRKIKEWEAWNGYRGVAKKDAQRMLINSLISHGVYTDQRTSWGKKFDDWAEKNEYINFQKVSPMLIIAWLVVKSVFHSSAAAAAGSINQARSLTRGVTNSQRLVMPKAFGAMQGGDIPKPSQDGECQEL